MVAHIAPDESLQVLEFVVLPLLVLLAATIVVLVRRHTPSIAQFQTFSVKLSKVGREDAYIIYLAEDKRVEFHASCGPNKQILLQAPRNLSDEEILEIGPALGMGLSKLGFREYSIRKDGETRIIAGSERPAGN